MMRLLTQIMNRPKHLKRKNGLPSNLKNMMTTLKEMRKKKTRTKSRNLKLERRPTKTQKKQKRRKQEMTQMKKHLLMVHTRTKQQLITQLKIQMKTPK